MSATIWAFRFDGGVWKRVPWSRYSRLTKGEVAIDEAPGTTLQCAQVIVGIEDRRPAHLGAMYFVKHLVGEHGLIDLTHEQEVTRQAVSMAFDKTEYDGNVIHAESRFAERKHQAMGRWMPSKSECQSLIELLRSLDVPITVEDQTRRARQAAQAESTARRERIVENEKRLAEGARHAYFVEYEVTYRGRVGPFYVEEKEGHLDVAVNDEAVDDAIDKNARKAEYIGSVLSFHCAACGRDLDFEGADDDDNEDLFAIFTCGCEPSA